MRFRVLGAVELVDERGQARPIGSPNQRTVLAVLLAARGEVVTIDALVEALWGDFPPASAVATVRTYVSRLRAHLGTALASRGGGFTLDIEADEVDAERFDSLVDAARLAGPNEAVGVLAAALDLWKGPAFGDRADVERVRPEARRLEERRATAREAHAAALLRAGRVDEAVAAAEALVTVEPLREGGWTVLIEALANAQRGAEAMRAFRRAADALAEVGLEPSKRLREAERVALRGDATNGRASGVHPRPPATPRRFVPPIVPSSFVGRDDDTDLVVDLLERARLVTLAGPGGVGKTRLALEVARRATDGFELGACFVELTPVENPATVADVVVAALGLTSLGRSAAELLADVGALDLLIVLDNAEHVIDGVAETVERILAGGPAVRILTTSRERLAVNGEHVWSVAPLATSSSESPAARLFHERASAVGARPDGAVVMRIVQRLDGLPLSIEMAAAQLDTTTADELADALDQHLDSLRSPRRQGPTRHRSLSDLLAWSEARLDEREARTLAELSVFAGPVITGDIDGVLGGPGVAEVVRSLATRSLVSVDRARTPTRFYLLQTIRSFAAHRLADSGRATEMGRRHALWFIGVARAADTQLRTVEEAGANTRLASVFAELRAAYGWAARHDVELAAELAAHLHLYAQSRFLDEPLAWGELLLDRLAADDRRRPILLASAAWRALRRGDIAQARRDASEAVSRAGDSDVAMPALDVLTDAGLFDGHVVESAVSSRTLRDLARRQGDLLYLTLGHSGAALSAAYRGVASSHTEAELGGLDELALPPSGRGWLAYTRGELCQRHDPHRALTHFGDALAEARTVNNRYIEGAAMVSYCSLQARVGDIDEALDAFAEAVRLWLRAANTTQQLTTLRNLAVLFQRVDSAEALADLLGTVDRGDVPTYGDEADRLNDTRAWAVTKLGAPRFAELNRAGASRDVTTAANVALQAIDALRSSRRRTAVHETHADTEETAKRSGSTGRQNSRMEHVDIGGIQIAYTHAGSGPPLVLVHGAPADSRTWQWMVADLARDHTVIAWDAPGFGQSSDIDDTWRAAQFADALAAFIAALGLERPHLVGHSFGTMVILSLFQRHPAVPASLVLIGGYAGWAGSLPPEEVARRLAMFLGMADLGEAFDPKSYPGLFTDLIPADRDPALATMMHENIRPATVRAAGHVGAETDLRPVLPTVDVPTLILHGEADARSPLANAETLHAAISTSQLAVLPKLGHACVVEDPEACATEIRRFVRNVG